MQVDENEHILEELAEFDEELEEPSEDDYKEIEEEEAPEEEKQLEEFDDSDLYDYKSIRDRVEKIYCHTIDDFNSIDEYNDYIEMKEITIYKLLMKIDEDEIKEQMKRHKIVTKDFRKYKKSYLNRLSKEEKDNIHRRYILKEHQKLTEKLRMRIEPLEDLSYNRKTTEEIFALGKELNVEISQDKYNKTMESVMPQNKIVNKKVYIPTSTAVPLNNIPLKPEPKNLNPNMISNGNILYPPHIRKEDKIAAANAAGFTKNLIDQRSIHEAFASLYFTPS